MAVPIYRDYPASPEPLGTRRGNIVTSDRTLFNNRHIHDFPQWHVVGVRRGENAEYCGWFYGCPFLDMQPEQLFIGRYSIKDIVLLSGMVKSHSDLKRKHLTLTRSNNGVDEEPYQGIVEPLGDSESIYTIRIGQRVLHIVTERDCTRDCRCL